MSNVNVQQFAVSESIEAARPLDIRDEIVRVRSLVDRRLNELVPPATREPQSLHESIRYSLLAPGKRIRPVLTVLVCGYFGDCEDLVLDPACAIEMVHTASLILDDMPSMDDASLRRGRPTNHLVFGEDTATLASVTLLNRAFGVIAEANGLSPEIRVDLTRMLSESIGSNGIIAGQFCDLRSNWEDRDLPKLIEMYGQKTGALFVASVETGARVARVPESWVASIRSFAMNLGMAFQILDDLLDQFATENEAGKNVGQDDAKTTFVSIMGPDKARIEACRYIRSAVRSLDGIGSPANSLVDLARSLMEPAMGITLHL